MEDNRDENHEEEYLSPLCQNTLRNSRKNRPDIVRKLEAEGTLREHLLEAEERFLDLVLHLRGQKVDAYLANELAEREFLLLPPDL